MKPSASIFLLLIAFLLIQPAMSLVLNSSVRFSCGEKQPPPTCSSTCGEDMPVEEEDCGMSPCNPLLGCPSGNFYIHDHNPITITSLVIEKQKTALLNDNRILRQSSECWHPPEA